MRGIAVRYDASPGAHTFQVRVPLQLSAESLRPSVTWGWHWHSGWPRATRSSLLRVLPLPRRTPLTFGYLVVLVASTLVLEAVPPELEQRILESASTDVAHLAHEPVQVLLGAPLWLPGRHLLGAAVLLTAVVAPAERHLGAARTLGGFAVGHVLGTLLTEVPVGVGISLGWLPASAAHRIDAGISYGVYCPAGLVIGMLVPSWRRFVLAGTLASVLVPLGLDPGVTSTGHLFSLLVGVAGWPWLRRRQLYGTLRGDLWWGGGSRRPPVTARIRRQVHHRCRDRDDLASRPPDLNGSESARLRL